MTIEELKAGQPSIRAKQQVIRRSDSDLSSNGGCDFKIMDPGELVAERILKREAYAVDQGDSFFPNCARQELGPWYNLVTHRGKYLVFSAKATAEAVMAPDILWRYWRSDRCGHRATGPLPVHPQPEDRQQPDPNEGIPHRTVQRPGHVGSDGEVQGGAGPGSGVHLLEVRPSVERSPRGRSSRDQVIATLRPRRVVPYLLRALRNCPDLLTPRFDLPRWVRSVNALSLTPASTQRLMLMAVAARACCSAWCSRHW